MKKVTLNGLNVYPFTSSDELIEFIEKEKGILVAINAEKVINATEQTRNIINRNLGYVDGSGVEIALHQKGYKNACKIAGCDLWLKIIDKLKNQKSFYFVGSKPEVIEETIEKLKIDFPGINILGFRDGYIKSEEEKEKLLKDIEDKKPDIVFVAMGSPKQELLMEEMQKRHKAIFQGLGGSFDVYTGNVERAPQWWIDHKLEFAYRLIKQPSRIRRQLSLLKFGYYLLLRKF